MPRCGVMQREGKEENKGEISAPTIVVMHLH